jgi:hypothetical protein
VPGAEVAKPEADLFRETIEAVVEGALREHRCRV